MLRDFIAEALCNPSDYASYYVSRRLAQVYPERAVVEGDACAFDLEEFTRAGLCSVVAGQSMHNQFVTDWEGPREGLKRKPENAWLNILWQGHLLDVLLLNLTEDGYRGTHFWILAETLEVGEAFFKAVCDWQAEVRGEILVFDGGGWQKSDELYESIRQASFENLVLPAGMKGELQGDLLRFFASRELYERYNLPWKRGVLLIGPPGNGKTHTVKALVNLLRQPCLYVKSFKSCHGTDQDNMRNVFRRARQTSPCLLVLEDVDSLVDSNTRSFFLNELDGFAANTGLAVLATTNHPEKLDPAILDRPSRFDRKFYFSLPAPAERREYVSSWNGALQEEMRLSEAGVDGLVELTEGFSFAYMKELFLSAMMQWLDSPERGRMDAVIAERATRLREQMRTGGAKKAGKKGED